MPPNQQNTPFTGILDHLTNNERGTFRFRIPDKAYTVCSTNNPLYLVHLVRATETQRPRFEEEKVEPLLSVMF